MCMYLYLHYLSVQRNKFENTFFNFIHLPAITLLDYVISQHKIHYLRQQSMKHILYIYFTQEINDLPEK